VQSLRDELAFKQKVIDKITHEMAVLKRLKFAATSEHFSPERRSLLEETIDTDLAAAQAELDKARAAAKAAAPADKDTPKRKPLPPELPRTEHRHEPESTTCTCGCSMKRIGEDVAEKLDYASGVFTVERHVRGKWVCADCETLVQAPVPPHVIDKGLPTCGLLAHVMIAKFIDHLPLYRQEKIFGRAGLAIPQSTLSDWVGTCGVQLQALVDALREELLTHRILHADETPVSMLKPGKGKTHRAYIWSYCTTSFDPVKAVVFDFTESRGGEHARDFLEIDTDVAGSGWQGTLVCDDYSGYKAAFAHGLIEAGCLAHARRKFYDLWATNRSAIAEEALEFFRLLYDVERDAQHLTSDERRRLRSERAMPIAKTLKDWLEAQRARVPDGSAIAKAIDYSRGRWLALTRYLNDGDLPCDTDAFDKNLSNLLPVKRVFVWLEDARANRRRMRGSPARRGPTDRAPGPVWPSRCSRAPGPACCRHGAMRNRPSTPAAESCIAAEQVASTRSLAVWSACARRARRACVPSRSRQPTCNA
jgi:transposase